jgi:ATP-dependent DNA helicase 2 subunit 2
MTISRSSVTVAAKVNNKAGMALSSLIHALYELDSYAVARLVERDGKEPKLILLAPSIEADFECLIDVELPFAEDVRQYKFPPLDRVVTVAGKSLVQHRNLPNDKLMQSMSDYVDSMDLSTFGKDDEGQPAEYAKMDDTYSPLVHRIQQALRWRAVHPSEPIPQPYDILMKYMNPPDELVKKSKSTLDMVVKAGEVKKVPPKQKGRKRGRDIEKPLSGLDVEKLLGSEKRMKISADNAIPEFRQLLATTEDTGAIEDASKQMITIIENYIKHSTGDSGYARAAEAIRVMREELDELEEPGIFNDFMRRLKKKILKGELGGERREMWWQIRRNRLGLIDKKSNPQSDITEEDAKAVGLIGRSMHSRLTCSTVSFWGTKGPRVIPRLMKSISANVADSIIKRAGLSNLGRHWKVSCGRVRETWVGQASNRCLRMGWKKTGKASGVPSFY